MISEFGIRNCGLNKSAIRNPRSAIRKPSFARAFAKATALKEGYGGRWFFDNIGKKISKIKFEKVTKGAWRMPWLSEAKKDVTSCDKLRGGANIRYIRRFPNGVTLPTEGRESRVIGRRTRGTETS